LAPIGNSKNKWTVNQEGNKKSTGPKIQKKTRLNKGKPRRKREEEKKENDNKDAH
jgi:hypothetical protein